MKRLIKWYALRKLREYLPIMTELLYTATLYPHDTVGYQIAMYHYELIEIKANALLALIADEVKPDANR